MLLKKKDKLQSEYDVCVIGSGLGGLTLAKILGKDGHKVLLLEAHNKLGGLATWFNRQQGKHTFDVSLHGFPVGMKKTLRKYWSTDTANLCTQLKDIRFSNPQYQIQSTFTKEDFTAILVNHFKIPLSKVESFFQFIQNLNFYENNKMTTGELFENFFPGRNDVHRFLMEPIVYANGSTLEDPAISYGIVFSNFMHSGVFTILGGTQLFIDSLKQQLLNCNVDIRMHSKVDRIIISNNQIQGIKVGSELVKAKCVVSNAHLHSTLFKLIDDKDRENINQQYLEKASKVRTNSSSCQVYIGLKKPAQMPALGDLLFTSRDDYFDTKSILKMHSNWRTFSFYYPHHRPQDLEPKGAIVSSTNAYYQDWATLDSHQYEIEKNKLIKDTVEHLKEFYPNIEDEIDYIEASTPKTFERYTHHPQGASFGTKFEGLEISMNLPDVVPGLFHTGSVGIIMSGWLGAANYGVIVANKVEEHLHRYYQKENHDSVQSI